MLTLGIYDIVRSVNLRNLRLSENIALEIVTALANLDPEMLPV